jgi:polyphosphate kinase
MRLSTVPEEVERPDLKYPGFVPGIPAALKKNPDIFAAVRHGDILVHHPYESFAPVIEFVRQASMDPRVMAIRQTLYRTGSDSSIVQALLAAAHAGKEVLVVIELRARFDEEANIELATVLQEAGANVVYGVVGLKTHAKMCLVVRREGRSFKRYVHLGTGNYHARTSRLYTDYGLFTCDPAIGDDVQKVFSQLTALGRHGRLKKILQSPFTLHSAMLGLIEREIQINVSGRGRGRIFLKMNSLVEAQAIQALYRASAAGVEVRLLIRGICCLRPGVPGVSDHIEVRSIVGRFLEHTRVFWFGNGGDDRLYLSSADWMGRNFFSRVEVCFPIEDPALRQRIIHELNEVYWRDTALSWLLQADGSYCRMAGNTETVSAQTILLGDLAGE